MNVLVLYIHIQSIMFIQQAQMKMFGGRSQQQVDQVEEEVNQEVPMESSTLLKFPSSQCDDSALYSPAASCYSLSSQLASTRTSQTSLASSPSSLSLQQQQLDNNWQANKASVRERNAVMFNNDLMADVYFVVGTAPASIRIPAHKYILATGSSVFYAMFYGGLAEPHKDIQIPDVEPAAFLNLLK